MTKEDTKAESLTPWLVHSQVTQRLLGRNILQSRRGRTLDLYTLKGPTMHQAQAILPDLLIQVQPVQVPRIHIAHPMIPMEMSLRVLHILQERVGKSEWTPESTQETQGWTQGPTQEDQTLEPIR